MPCQVESIHAERGAVRQGKPIPRPAPGERPRGFKSKQAEPLDIASPAVEQYYAQLPPLQQWVRLEDGLIIVRTRIAYPLLKLVPLLPHVSPSPHLNPV